MHCAPRITPEQGHACKLGRRSISSVLSGHSRVIIGLLGAKENWTHALSNVEASSAFLDEHNMSKRHNISEAHCRSSMGITRRHWCEKRAFLNGIRIKGEASQATGSVLGGRRTWRNTPSTLLKLSIARFQWPKSANVNQFCSCSCHIGAAITDVGSLICLYYVHQLVREPLFGLSLCYSTCQISCL
jgi:hypothetical protein